MGSNPWGLADDLTIYAIGERRECRFKRGYKATLAYLELIGAKPAPTKCYTFSSVSTTRFRLSQEYWSEVGSTVKVIQSTRDLGGHLSTLKILNAATLTACLRRALVLCNKLAYFRWPWQPKQKSVRALILSMALYGCEAAPVSLKDMAKLLVSISKAIGPYTPADQPILCLCILLHPG